MQTTQFSNGEFCWLDLGTTNMDEAKAFYSTLFGWTAETAPAGAYTMFHMAGKDACAFFAQKEGMPANWYAYVTVTNVDAVAKKALELKGTLVSTPTEVKGPNGEVFGRMCLIQDPTGATCAAWEPKAYAGASAWMQTGTPCWFELMTNNIDVAGGFWAKLFGWTLKPTEIPGVEYTQFFIGNKAVGGMMSTKAMPNTPSHWLSYVAVENCDATCAKAKTLGATVVKAPTDIPTVGRFAVFADPQGATFAVIQPFTTPTNTTTNN